MNANSYLKFLIGALLGFALAAFIRGCGPDDNDTNVANMPEETKRVTVINTDSIRSEIEAEFRAPLLARIKADSVKLAELRAKLPKSKEKATTGVIAYQKSPTIANCDTAIAELQHYAGEMEAGLAIADSVMKNQSRVIGSFAGTVKRKDSLIVELNTGWQKANEDKAILTQRLSKEKSKRFGIGFSAGYGMSDAGLSPTVNISLNYNLIKF